jgi:transcriptional regulator with XRE-family HTH domain
VRVRHLIMPPVPTPRGSQAESSFGGRLRRERERRRIALESIAENTKISMSFFEDLERDDVSRWPSGIFRKSFIRAYAQAIGLDPDEVTREFLERFPDPNDPTMTPLVTSSGAAAAAASGGAAHAVPAHPPKPATLRIVATTGRSFVGGRVLPSLGDRLMAIGWDALIVLTLGLLLYAAFGVLWAPLCLAIALYYGAGVLLLGNTPGVCLCAPASRKADGAATTTLGGILRECAAVIGPRLGRRRES